MIDLVTAITNDHNNKIKGYVLTGKNNAGKTYRIYNLLEAFCKKHNTDGSEYSDLLNEREYNITDTLFLSKQMNRNEFNIKPPKALGILDDDNLSNLTTLKDLHKIVDFESDSLDYEDIGELIYATIVSDIDKYQTLIKRLLDITIDIDSDKNLILVTNDELTKLGMDTIKNTKDLFALKSNGYLSIIRIIVFLDVFLNKDIKWILMDEPDADMDASNSSIFVDIIEFLKKEKNCDAKFVFASHNSVSLYNLPADYKIFKLEGKKIIKELYSQDFFSKSTMENVLFDEKNRKIYKSTVMEDLITIYKKSLVEKDFDFSSIDKFTYRELSTKEKVIFNSIKQLGGIHD